MAFWEGKAGSAAHLRLFEPVNGWQLYDDIKDPEGRTTAQGAVRAIELALHTALNASNLLLLTGAGSSFCARNRAAGTTAPTMTNLWDAVEAAVTPPKFQEIVGLIPNATGLNKNIEKLLTLCKLSCGGWAPTIRTGTGVTNREGAPASSVASQPTSTLGRLIRPSRRRPCRAACRRPSSWPKPESASSTAPPIPQRSSACSRAFAISSPFARARRPRQASPA